MPDDLRNLLLPYCLIGQLLPDVEAETKSMLKAGENSDGPADDETDSGGLQSRPRDL